MDFKQKFTEKMHYFVEEAFEITKMIDFNKKDREYILPIILKTDFRWSNVKNNKMNWIKSINLFKRITFEERENSLSSKYNSL